MPKTAFVYSDEFSRFDYGPSHPLKIIRLKLTHDLIERFGLLNLPFTRRVEARPAGDEELVVFHDRRYIEVLKAASNGVAIPDAYVYGLGPGDNPIFKGLMDWSRLVAGASLQAGAMVDDGEVATAFSLSGGLHHAKASRASGFCYVNDVVLAIMALIKRGRRVAYIDIDAHHADGVQEAFFPSDKVLTVSFHETGKSLFPGTGFEDESGVGQGRGYTVNVPLPAFSDDELFVFAFDEIVPPLLERFRPDIVVSQLGVDSFRSDPLAHLNYTTNGFCDVVRKIGRMAAKWVALGGGGYNISNVVKAWTLAWAIMNGAEIPDEIPADFLNRHRESISGKTLRDEKYLEEGPRKEEMRKEVQRTIGILKRRAELIKGR